MIKKTNKNKCCNVGYIKTFNTLIEGNFNSLAYQSAIEICNLNKPTKINPLVILGNSGTGKSHIAKAVKNNIKTKFPDKLGIYITSAEFNYQMVNAIRINKKDDFGYLYKLFEVFIIEDVQDFSFKNESQKILESILDYHIYMNNRILITSNIEITESNGFNVRLVSIINKGVTALLENPGFDDRMNILNLKTIDNRISYDILKFIASKSELNIGEMEGLLTTIIAKSFFLKKDIDLQMAADTFCVFKSKIDSI